MSPAYKSLVKLYYKKKKGEHALPSGLMYPTPASLRDECLAALRRGILKKDRKVLIDYFDENGDDEAIFKKIRKYDIDGFKPIQNFLKKEDGSTDPKRVELLAWLIGFEGRPYDDRKEYTLNDLQTNISIVEAIQDVEQNKEEKENQVKQNGKNDKPEIKDAEPPQLLGSVVTDKNIEQLNDADKKAQLVVKPSIGIKQPGTRKAIFFTSAAVILVGIFIYTEIGGKGSANLMGSTFSKEEGSCMYWAGDHYQQVPCNQKMGGALVIALDTGMLNSFKKITREDTITSNDIGRIWYIKHNNKVEFYTASGNYPLDPTLRLKPITEHIINTYIVTKR